MLKLKSLSETAQGTWFDFTVRGEKLGLKVRPLTNEVMEGIRSKHKEVKMVRDPQTKSLVRVPTYDDDKIGDDMIDHVLEEFKGVGDDNGDVLQPTLENKKRVMNIPPLEGEDSVATFVFERAKELAVTISADKVAREKVF